MPPSESSWLAFDKDERLLGADGAGCELVPASF
jgi:hypothetical protein